MLRSITHLKHGSGAVLMEEVEEHSSSFELVTSQSCHYDLELTRGDETFEDEVDFALQVRPRHGERLPQATELSAWQLRTYYTPVRVMGGAWGTSPTVSYGAADVSHSPDAVRLLASESATPGEYLVEGATLETASGVWYVVAEIPTDCGTDMAGYILVKD